MPVTFEIPPVEAPGGSLYADGRPVDKRSETIAGGASFGLMSLASTVQTLTNQHTEAERRYGPRIFEAMMRDGIAGGSVDVLKYAALANEIVVQPKVRPRPGRKADDQDLVDRAARAAERAQYALDRLETPIGQTGFEMYDAMPFGASLTEIVWDTPTRGKWAGQLLPKALKPKARRTWMFAVDAFFNVKGIVSVMPDAAGWQLLPREKFVVMTFGGRGGDPRGSSILDRAAEPWNFRVQLPNQHFKFCQRHGSPVPVGTLPENQSFSEVNGVEVNPEQEMLGALLGYQNGKVLVLPNGATVTLSEPKSRGEVFTVAGDFYRREIILAILLQARTTMEAVNGSKADSETSENVVGNILRYLKRWFARALEWDLLYKISLYNDGPEEADLLTPTIESGQVEHQDIASLLTALGSVGYTLDPSQMPEIDAEAGMPVRDMDETPEAPETETEPADPNTPPKGAETP